VKIEGHVTEVSDHGEKLKVIGQAQAVVGYNDPGLKPWLTIAVDIPMNDRNRKAFHVGRHFDLVLKPTA
jgi:hypothetical protein